MHGLMSSHGHLDAMPAHAYGNYSLVNVFTHTQAHTHTHTHTHTCTHTHTHAHTLSGGKVGSNLI